MQNTMLDSAISNSLQLFENTDWKVRVVMRDGEPWFVAKDVCECLDLGNPSQAIARLEDDERRLISNEALRANGCLAVVSEPGLYSLVLGSRKPEAKAFKRWVTHEVLPFIRKTGSYSVNQTQQQSMMCLPQDYESALEALLMEVRKNKALQAERDEAIRTKTQYQSNLAAQMSGRVGGLTTALNRVKLENDRLKGDRLTKEDVYIIMNTQGVSFTLKTVKDIIRESLNTISEYLNEPFPKIKTGERTDSNGKTFDVQSYVYTRKTVQAFFEYVENNPMGWQARNRKFILGEWLNHYMTIPA